MRQRVLEIVYYIKYLITDVRGLIQTVDTPNDLVLKYLAALAKASQAQCR